MAGPGQQKQIFDYNLLHRVGSASAPGSQRYKQRKTPWIERAVFNFLGNQVADYANAARERRRKFRQDNENSDADFAATIADEKGSIKDLYSDAAQEFTTLRNQGQKLVRNNHGFANSKLFKGKAKKYAEGVAMMNKAQMCLTNLEADARSRLAKKNKYSSIQLNGTTIDTNGNTIKAEWAEYNTPEIDNRTLALMDGSLDEAFVVNSDDGHLELLEEDNSKKQMMSEIMYTPEEIAEYEANYKPEIKRTTWNEIEFNKTKDTSALHIQSDARNTGGGLGEKGIEWDESVEMGLRADAQQDVNKLTPSAFNSWFWSGTHYKYRDAGKTFMTPAEDYIAQKYKENHKALQTCKAFPNAVGCDEAKMEYKGILNSLKQQDLQEGDEYKEFAIQSIIDVAKQYHAIAKATYDEKHKDKKDKPQKRDQVMVDGGKIAYADAQRMAANMFGGKGTEYSTDEETKYVQDGKGGTTIYEKRYEKILDNKGWPTGEKRFVGWKNPQKTTTNDAAKQRGLYDFSGKHYEDMPEEVPFKEQGFGGKYVRGGGQMIKNFRTADDYLNEID